MHKSIAIIYNQPAASPYRDRNEQSAEDGVLVEVAAVEKALHFLGYYCRLNRLLVNCH